VVDRGELEQALRHYQDTVRSAYDARDWSRFGQLFSEAPNLTILHYAGEGLFSYEEDVYNPARFLQMVVGWATVADAHGRLPDEGRRWLAKYGAR
jgi:hypothetical protein